MTCRTAVVCAAILLLSANTVRADDGMGPSPTACEKSGDAGQWTCPGTDTTINCEYVCDDYEPADCDNGADEDADFCAVWNGGAAGDGESGGNGDIYTGGDDTGSGASGDGASTDDASTGRDALITPSTTTTSSSTTLVDSIEEEPINRQEQEQQQQQANATQKRIFIIGGVVIGVFVLFCSCCLLFPCCADCNKQSLEQGNIDARRQIPPVRDAAAPDTSAAVVQNHAFVGVILSDDGGGSVGGHAGLEATSNDAYIWECSVDGAWHRYGAAETNRLEAAFIARQITASFVSRGIDYRFENLQDNWRGTRVQVNKATGKSRPIRRKMAHREDSTEAGVGTLDHEPIAKADSNTSTYGPQLGSLPDWKSEPQKLANYNANVKFWTIPNVRTAEVTRENHELKQALAQMCFMLPGFDITSVLKVSFFLNKKAKARYADRKTRFAAAGRSTEERWVFHGTAREEYALSIMASHFRIGGQNGHPINNGDVHGQGVYTDQSPETATIYGKFVVLSLAIPGKEFQDAPQHKLRHTQNFDSWSPGGSAGRLEKSWTVFKRASQLLPIYIVYMK